MAQQHDTVDLSDQAIRITPVEAFRLLSTAGAERFLVEYSRTAGVPFVKLSHRVGLGNLLEIRIYMGSTLEPPRFDLMVPFVDAFNRWPKP